MLLYLLLCHESSTPLPVDWWVVQYIVDLQSRIMHVQQLVKFVLHENVFFIDIGINQTDGGFVEWVLECCFHDLEHRGDTGASSNHPNMLSQGRLVLEGTFWAFHADFVANLQE